MADLSCTIAGVKSPNPFWLASAPPTDKQYNVERAFEAGDEVNPESLRTKSLAKRRYDLLKILGDGELTKKLKVSAHRFSKSAREKIEKAGGETVVLPGKKAVPGKRKDPE